MPLPVAMTDLHDGIWRVPCIVVRVIDADTIRVNADLGWGMWKHGLDVRLDGLWSPENSTPEGRAATDWAKVILPAGMPLTLHSKWVQTFARVVGSLFLPGGEDYAELVIAAGLGTSVR